jgi:hypothetical protein
VLDVDYSGSCGYGREYRNRLLGRWGVADLQDVIAGAAHCVGGGLADGKRVAIDGGSAGGYTTLCALAFQGEAGPFTAGCSKYGIADLMALYDDTHKFESRYMDRLIGELPAMADVYKARCPIKYARERSERVGEASAGAKRARERSERVGEASAGAKRARGRSERVSGSSEASETRSDRQRRITDASERRNGGAGAPTSLISCTRVARSSA